MAAKRLSARSAAAGEQSPELASGEPGMLERIPQLQMREPSKLAAHPRNARTHPPEQIAAIKAMVLRFGWTNPLLIDEHDTIIAGHARNQVALEIARLTVPVIVMPGLTDVEKRELMLADNRIAMNAGWNADLLRQELYQLRGEGVNLEALGFAAAELDDLLPAPDPVAIEDVDVSQVADRFWISVRGPLASQALTFQRLHELMKEIPGVSVEHGTVNDG